MSTVSNVDLGTGRTALAFAAGIFHTCAFLDDHSVKCWGMSACSDATVADAKTVETNQRRWAICCRWCC